METLKHFLNCFLRDELVEYIRLCRGGTDEEMAAMIRVYNGLTCNERTDERIGRDYTIIFRRTSEFKAIGLMFYFNVCLKSRDGFHHEIPENLKDEDLCNYGKCGIIILDDMTRTEAAVNIIVNFFDKLGSK